MVLSRLALTIFCPSGPKRAEVTGRVWPSMVCWHTPVATSQTRTVLSFDTIENVFPLAVTISRPSKLNSAEFTGSVCPAIVCMQSPVCASHKRTVLSRLADTTFVHFLEFTAVTAYGTLSTVACLAAAEPDDPSDLLDATMWEECGPIVLSNFCLGMLIVVVFFMKLAVVETGIADVHAIMTFDIPRGIKFIALNMALMGCITLYYQAATNFYMDLRVAFVMVGAFAFLLSNVGAASAVGLPLKAVVEGTHRPVAIARQTTGQSLARSRSALGGG